MGYKIALQTNAKIFSKKQICEKITHYNLDITTHIHSGRAKIHDAITRSPGSFQQTILAIKNLKSYSNSLTVKIMITRLNYKETLQTAKFLSELPIRDLWLVFLTPDGFSKLYFDQIVPTYSQSRRYIEETLDWLGKHSRLKVTLEGIPYCCLKKDFFHLMMEKPKKDETSMYCIYPSGNKDDEYYALQERVKQKIKLPQCSICKEEHKCEGIYETYINKRGLLEFNPVK